MTSIAQKSNGPHLRYVYSDFVSFLKLQYPFIVSAWKKKTSTVFRIYLFVFHRKKNQSYWFVMNK